MVFSDLVHRAQRLMHLSLFDDWQIKFPTCFMKIIAYQQIGNVIFAEFSQVARGLQLSNTKICMCELALPLFYFLSLGMDRLILILLPHSFLWSQASCFSVILLFETQEQNLLVVLMMCVFQVQKFKISSLKRLKLCNALDSIRKRFFEQNQFASL